MLIFLFLFATLERGDASILQFWIMEMKKALCKIVAVAAGVAMAFSCSADLGDLFDGMAARDGGYAYDGAEGMAEPSGTGEGENNGNTRAGLLTAGEWNDLDNWQFWGKLMLSQGDGKADEDEDGDGDEGLHGRRGGLGARTRRRRDGRRRGRHARYRRCTWPSCAARSPRSRSPAAA